MLDEEVDGLIMCTVTGCVNVGWIHLTFHMFHWLNIFHVVTYVCQWLRCCAKIGRSVVRSQLV